MGKELEIDDKNQSYPNGDSSGNTERRTSKSSKASSDYHCKEEGKYGWFNFTPDWLQRFNNPKGFLAAFGFFSITQGMLVNGLVNVSITTLERRFQLTSFELGIVGCSYDIAFCLLCLFVTYYGNHAHRPRLLAIGSVIMGTGAIVFALPHYITGNYKYETEFSDSCIRDGPTSSCSSDGDEENLHAFLYVLILGQLLHGTGATPLYTLGYAFMEDSVKKEEASMYLGLANALSIFGPVLGYIIGGYLLSIYVDFDSPEAMASLTLEPSDPRWVGAWWVGMLLAAGMAYGLVTGPMSGFPKQLPGTARNRAMRESEVHASAGAEVTEQQGFGRGIKDFPIALMKMLSNPTFMLTTLAGCTETLVISGFATFLPKLIENEFRQTAGAAALLAGVISVPGGVVGHVLAGYLVKRFNMSTTDILKYCVVCCISVIALSPILLLHCDASAVAGVNVPYGNSSNVPDPADLNNPCNAGCDCQEAYFMPVCGEDGKGYFSACQAGCDVIENTTMYFDCTCITTGNNTATEGLCEEQCNLVAPFLVVFFLVVMICFMSTAPALVVTFRCVPDSQRSFAIGVQWLFMRAFGSIPGPIIFGAVIDTTCILWQEKLCNRGRGSCWIYDNNNMGLYMLLIGLCGKLLSVVLFGSAAYFYKPMKSDEDKDDISMDDPQKENGIKFDYDNEGFTANDDEQSIDNDPISNGKDIPVTSL
ncbi:solute carrier organic anion transporter family member 4C1-like [Styela clava]